jgi:hypothetical protein
MLGRAAVAMWWGIAAEMENMTQTRQAILESNSKNN